MLSILASIEVDHGFQPGQVISKTIKLVLAASLLRSKD